MPTLRTFKSLVDDGVLLIGDGYRAKNSELGGSGPIFLRSAYLQNDGFKLDGAERFSSCELARFGAKISQENDVVITTKGNSTGRTGRVRRPQSGAVYSPHLSYWRSKNPEIIDQGFLFYWSSSRQFKNQLAGLAYSTDMAPYLSLRDQLFLEITLPDIDVQRSIGELLSSLDDKIELNRQMNETLEASARALFRDWFVDFGPTKAKMAGAAPYLAPDLWALFPNRLDNDGIPEGWTLGNLSELIEFNPREKLAKGTKAPYIDMAALPTAGSIIEDIRYREFKSGSKFRFGDTLMARITPCLENGKTGYVDCLDDNAVGSGSTEFFVLRARDRVPPEFAYLIARDHSFRSVAIQSMSGTSGRQRATKEALEHYPFAQPDSTKVWDEFEKIVRPLFDRIKANRRENATLGETRDLLLPKLMSGEIRVGEAEQTISEIA